MWCLIRFWSFHNFGIPFMRHSCHGRYPRTSTFGWLVSALLPFCQRRSAGILESRITRRQASDFPLGLYTRSRNQTDQQKPADWAQDCQRGTRTVELNCRQSISPCTSIYPLVSYLRPWKANSGTKAPWTSTAAWKSCSICCRGYWFLPTAARSFAAWRTADTSTRLDVANLQPSATSTLLRTRPSPLAWTRLWAGRAVCTPRCVTSWSCICFAIQWSYLGWSRAVRRRTRADSSTLLTC